MDRYFVVLPSGRPSGAEWLSAMVIHKREREREREPGLGLLPHAISFAEEQEAVDFLCEQRDAAADSLEREARRTLSLVESIRAIQCVVSGK